MSAIQMDLSKPQLMTSFTEKWPCHSWTFKTLADLLGGKKFSCRIAPKSCVQKRETQCSHQDVTIEQFCDWLDGTTEESNPLSHFKREENSCYVDYKYMKDMFEDHPETFEQVQWKDFGLFDFDGYDSTIWLSSEGANTPGHQDTYGFNLITQICGKKLWILFPPEDSQYLYPTRVPYEESSIFTEVNFRRPNLQAQPKFKLSHPVVVTVCAGQTLYVPRHWWHYVESVEPSISINVWIPMKADRSSRLSEAITRCLATSLITSLDTSEDNLLQSAWLNPTESLAPTTVNLLMLKAALAQLLGDSDISIMDDVQENVSDAHGLTQEGDLHRHRDINKTGFPDLELSFTPSVNSVDGSIIKGTACTSVEDFVVPDSDLAGRSILSLLAERLKGHTAITVDTPFQLNYKVKLLNKRTADVPQGSSAKRYKPELASLNESIISCSGLSNETSHSHPRIFLFRPCSFDSYLRFVDNLCGQIGCRQCHNGQSIDTKIEPCDGKISLSGTHTVMELFSNNVLEVGMPHEEDSKTEDGYCKCSTENVCNPFPQSSTDNRCRKSTSLDSHNKQEGENDVNNSRKEEKNLSFLRDENADSTDSDSRTRDGTFRGLSQLEVAETLLTCVLHPDVVTAISLLFKEKCEDRLRQKHLDK